jgi:hypothetical protein
MCDTSSLALFRRHGYKPKRLRTIRLQIWTPSKALRVRENIAKADREHFVLGGMLENKLFFRMSGESSVPISGVSG